MWPFKDKAKEPARPRSSGMLTRDDFDAWGRQKNDKINPLSDPDSTPELKYAQYAYQAMAPVIAQACRTTLVGSSKDLSGPEMAANFVRENPDNVHVKIYKAQLAWAEERYMNGRSKETIDNVPAHLASIANPIFEAEFGPALGGEPKVAGKLDSMRRGPAFNDDLPVAPKRGATPG